MTAMDNYEQEVAVEGVKTALGLIVENLVKQYVFGKKSQSGDSKPDYFKTDKDAREYFGVPEKAFRKLKQLPDFPKPSPWGSWKRISLEAWEKRHEGESLTDLIGEF